MTPLELEAALVTWITRGGERPSAPAAVWFAVASRYLAVGTPRSFGIIGAGGESLAAHHTWFAPTDLRCTDAAVAAAIAGRIVSVDEALAADIVCVHADIGVETHQLRRGTHVNTVGTADVLGARVADVTELARMAAGLVDGRQLDEITIFIL